MQLQIAAVIPVNRNEKRFRPSANYSGSCCAQTQHVGQCVAGSHCHTDRGFDDRSSVQRSRLLRLCAQCGRHQRFSTHGRTSRLRWLRWGMAVVSRDWWCGVLPAYGIRQVNTNMLKVAYKAVYDGNPSLSIRSVTCHMESHSFACHVTQLNAPVLTPAKQAGTRFIYPRGMKG